MRQRWSIHLEACLLTEVALVKTYFALQLKVLFLEFGFNVAYHGGH